MALFVPCALCGPRPVEEFLYGEVISVPESITDPEARDVDRVFMRNNPEGAAPEGWFHSAGCRRWTYTSRDRSTSEWM